MNTMTISEYAHFNDNEVHHFATYGSYFPAVAANPGKYIQAQPTLRQTLTQLKNSGKRLFIGSNSHIEVLDMIMTATIDAQWKNLFDLSIGNTKKPGFQRLKDILDGLRNIAAKWMWPGPGIWKFSKLGIRRFSKIQTTKKKICRPTCWSR